MGDANFGLWFSAEDTPKTLPSLAAITDNQTWSNEEYWQGKDGVGGTTAYLQIQSLVGELGYSPGAGTGPSGSYDTVRTRLDAITALFGGFLAIDGSSTMAGNLNMGGYDIDDCGKLVIDKTDSEALLVRKGGDVGDVFVVDTSGQIVTINATTMAEDIIIDDTSTEALLVRKSGDTGDVFVVNTNADTAILNAGITVNGYIFCGEQLTVDVDHANAFLVRTEADVAVFNVATDVGSVNITADVGITGALTNDGRIIIDETNTEAFLVRKNSDTGDVFTVNTTSEVVTISGVLVQYGQIQSQVTTGTSPLSIGSTTLCSFLNADLLDGNHASAFSTITAHSGLSGLTSGDDHTQYLLLAGRAGGQSFNGGTGAGDDLKIDSTFHGTKGNITINPEGGFVGIGGAVSAHTLEVTGNTNVTGATNVGGDLTVNTNKMTVAGATGNTVIAGTLDCGFITGTGGMNLANDLAINTNKFTVSSATGNILIAGTTSINGVVYAWPATAGTNTFVFTTDGAGTLAWTVRETGTVTGTGTTNYVAKWSAASVLTDSTIFDAGAGVGIGTVTPSDELEVEKDQNAGTVIRVDNNTSGTGAYSQLSALSDAGGISILSHSSAYTTSNQYVQDSGLIEAINSSQLGISAVGNVPTVFYNNAAETVRITGAGFVGIGTAGPSGLLDIEGGSYPTAYITSTGANGGQLVLGSSTKDWTFYVQGSDLRIYEGGVGDKVTILAGGNVGIGTVTPATNLEISHVTNPEIYIDDTNGKSVSFGAGNDGVYIGYNSTGYFEIATVTGARTAGYAAKVRITSAGNVGINTTGPDRKLDVLDASNPQLRLTHTDGAKYSDFQTDTNGYLLLTTTGGLVQSTSNLNLLRVSPQINLQDTAATGTTGIAIWKNTSTATGFMGVVHNTSRFEVGGAVGISAHLFSNDDEVITILSNAVGINETNPTHDLHVTNSGADTTFFVEHNDVTNMAAAVVSVKYGLAVQSAATGTEDVLAITGNSGSTLCLHALANGRVGIGTSISQTNLHIESAVPTIRMSDNNAATDLAVATLVEFYRGNNTSRVGYLGMESSSNNDLKISTDYSAGRITLGTGSNATALTIDSSQNVGIGITPAVNLHVYSTGLPIFRVQTNTTTSASLGTININKSGIPVADATFQGAISITGKDTSGNAHTYGQILCGTTNTAHATEASYMAFYATGAGTSAERFRVHGTGVSITGKMTKLLDLEMAGAITYAAEFYNSNATNGFGIFAKVNHTNDWPIAYFGNSAGKVMSVNANGQVTINHTDSTRLFISSSSVNSSAHPALRLDKTGTPIAATTFQGSILFYGKDGAGNVELWGKIQQETSVTTSGSERGNLTLYTNNAGSLSAFLKLDYNGNLTGTHGAYFPPSDRRLKNRISTIDNSLEILRNLRGVYYYWNEQSRGLMGRQIGLVAQEVEKWVPEAVFTNESGIKTVYKGDLVALCINSIKEVDVKVESHTERIERLEHENTELREEVELLKAA